MVRFSVKPKNEPHSLPLRERSERKAQKSLWSYAHPSIEINNKNTILLENCHIFTIIVYKKTYFALDLFTVTISTLPTTLFPIILNTPIVYLSNLIKGVFSMKIDKNNCTFF
ncbi:MAG: hypothetical protein U5L45_22950 [Saprospiraceae bacterium]|nr:hypothetical protein [Saprospiraceae bacterium]